MYAKLKYICDNFMIAFTMTLDTSSYILSLKTFEAYCSILGAPAFMIFMFLFLCIDGLKQKG